MIKNPSQKSPSPCRVCITTKIHAHIKKHMIQRVYHTNMYVLLVLPYLARHLLTLKVNVEIKIVYQKTNE